jgi:hypothetical protein
MITDTERYTVEDGCGEMELHSIHVCASSLHVCTWQEPGAAGICGSQYMYDAANMRCITITIPSTQCLFLL